jgi:hypothetical protein
MRTVGEPDDHPDDDDAGAAACAARAARSAGHSTNHVAMGSAPLVLVTHQQSGGVTLTSDRQTLDKHGVYQRQRAGEYVHSAADARLSIRPLKGAPVVMIELVIE